VGKDVQISIKNDVQEAASTEQSVTNEKEELQKYGFSRSVKYFGLVLERCVTVETTMEPYYHPVVPQR
jgi:hypothetical protein